MTLDPNKFSSDFVNVKEIGCLTLDFIGSDKLKELFTTAECGQTKEFQNGARWGMAMLMTYLGAEATHFYVDDNKEESKWKQQINIFSFGVVFILNGIVLCLL